MSRSYEFDRGSRNRAFTPDEIQRLIRGAGAGWNDDLVTGAWDDPEHIDAEEIIRANVRKQYAKKGRTPRPKKVRTEPVERTCEHEGCDKLVPVVDRRRKYCDEHFVGAASERAFRHQGRPCDYPGCTTIFWRKGTAHRCDAHRFTPLPPPVKVIRRRPKPEVAEVPPPSLKERLDALERRLDALEGQ